MLRNSELDFLYTQDEIDLIDDMKKDILKVSKRYQVDRLSQKMLYTFKDYNNVLKFFEDDWTFRYDGDNTKGFLYFRFWDGGRPNNGMQFYTPESMWVWTSIPDFHRVLFGDDNSVKYTVISKTSPKQPKITKPKDLRGIRQITSVPYIGGRAKCGVFIKGDDVWVKHTDYFSPVLYKEELSGTPISVRAEYFGLKKPTQSFIYEDNWGSIIQKIQAWIKVENLYSHIAVDTLPSQLAYTIIREVAEYEDMSVDDLSVSYMSRFWENVIQELKRYKYAA